MELRRPRLEPSLCGRIIERFPLLYAEGPDAALDRPPHVRAGSGLAFVDTPSGRRLAVVQDDALFVALVDVGSRSVCSVTLPAGEGGSRQFDDVRGNKKHKLDLEALLACELDGAPALLAVGSGSLSPREVMVSVRSFGEAPDVRVHPLPALYARLHADKRFSGSELNLEGAVLLGDRLRLFQRGNGAPREGLVPVDATGELSWPALLAHLEDPASPPPALEGVTRWALGDVDGVPVTFTDAAAGPAGAVLYLAVAERSPSATEDGEVVGAALGVMAKDGSARQGPLLDEEGAPLRAKPEGLALDPDEPGGAWVVLDRDDPERAAELCRVELSGL